MDPMNLTPYFLNGLRPLADLPKGAPYCDRYQDLMACSRGAKALPSPTWPVGFPAIHSAWPAAEGFYDERVALAVVNNAFYTLSPTALTSAAVTIKDALSTGSDYTVQAGSAWHFCAFLDSWFATNGVSFVYKAPSTASNLVVGHHTAFSIQCLANWNNRLVLGGIGAGTSSNRTTSTAFTNLYNLWARRNKQNVVTSEDDSWDTTWLLIGPPVGGDSSIPHAAILALLGIPSDTAYTTVFEAQCRSWMEQGLIDFLPLRSTGALKRIEVYGSELAAYGAEGVSLVRDSEIGPIEEQVSPIGVWGRGAVGGTKDERLSLGKDGNAYMLGGGSRYARPGVYEPVQVGRSMYCLGWAEFLGTLASGDSTIISHDPSKEKSYWIADADDAYLLSLTGLCRSKSIVPSCIFRMNGSTSLIGACLANIEYQSNGTFASATGWTAGTGWSIAGGVAACTAGSATLAQSEASMAVVPVDGQIYTVQFTVSGYSAGSMTVSLNGGAASDAISADGTYKIALECGTNTTGLVFTPTAATLTLDNVSIVAGVDIRTHPFDAGMRNPFTVERLDLTTSDTATDANGRWKARARSKLQKHLSATTFSFVSSDIRGVIPLEQLGIEHDFQLVAADRTAVDLDGLLATLSNKTPSLRNWLNTI